ncbi:T9SS type A sorting domain-containing protein [Psychroflexus gondwanensis]|uniref:type IX secretion system anionic LPS delivery protein PorZ n=1 Tax=Psychroflexus gondwanensis TaxID=251 RepID=UPI0011BF21B1|nr:T9SS type A sorting domain-containing protein [Psychroflexus gondwanensis]TXE21194.1 T9SS type A sorting domain-containing protein [Psychroflexus gondwanensis]
MKNFVLIVLIFPSIVLCQDFSDRWKGYFSYYNITDLDESGNKVYAAAENAYFIYDIPTQTLQTVTSIEGLSGNKISKIYHSENYGLTCIGYEDGLIQIVMDNNQNIFSVVDIRDKISISPNNKRINNFFEFEGKLYISTDFGIAEYSLQNLEFEDSFFIGTNGSQIQINQITILEGKIYAATSLEGIKSADITSPNLIDFEVWQTEYTGNWKGVLNFSNTIFGLRNNNTISTLQNGTASIFNAVGSNVTGFNVSGEQLVITAANQVSAYNSELNLEAFIDQLQDVEFSINTSVSSNGQYFLGHSSLGLLNFQDSSTTVFSELSPAGPLLNRIFSLEATASDLWVTFGEYDQFLNPFPLNSRGLSHLTEEEWINIDVENLNNARELSNVSIDPSNPNRVFVSSFFDGLLEIENNELIQQYDSSNSIIEGVPSNINDNRIGASVFDSQGNLYFTNSIAENQLKRLNANGEFVNIDMSDGYLNPTETSSSKMVIDNNNNIFIGTLKDGVVAYSPTTNTSALISSNIQGVEFPDTFNANPNITALEIDQNSRLWIGTQAGLRVMSNPTAIFNENQNVRVSPIIIEDVDGLPQELLFEQFITDITTDGANNKWISTADSGVFQVSANGQDILNIFNVDNSPLPTNSVRTVSINQSTGEVFFGTTSGLLSYSSRVTSGNETLENLRAYPNPVRPNYTGLVIIDGLTNGANVKITDVSGNLVFEEFVDGGSLQWDTRAFGKHKVASGVYFIVVTGEDQIETKVGKIMIIR